VPDYSPVSPKRSRPAAIIGTLLRVAAKSRR
jgi:hypothetical protein